MGDRTRTAENGLPPLFPTGPINHILTSLVLTFPCPHESRQCVYNDQLPDGCVCAYAFEESFDQYELLKVDVFISSRSRLASII
jgi:hypothetical protein